MIIAAIDYSYTSPSITIFDTTKELCFDNVHSFYLTDKKRYSGDFGNVFGHFYKGWKDNQERFEFISEWAIQILKKYEVQKAFIEDYAFAAKGQVFTIGENTGLLKNKLWKFGIPFETVTSGTWKKGYMGAGKGAAGKDVICQFFVDTEGVNLADRLGTTKLHSTPVNDIVDSFGILKYSIKALT